MEHKIYHYPVWIRLWHLFNAILCLTLIITGLNMQYSNPENAFISFNIAVSMHNIAGILLSVNYLIFFIGNIATKNWRFYKINRNSIVSQLKQQISYYTNGIFKASKTPFPITKERKFNPLQQTSYILIMYIAVPIIIITGWALLFPEINLHKIFGTSGLLLTDILHITVGFFVSVFLIVHVYFCTTGIRFGSIFKSMINGWSEVH